MNVSLALFCKGMTHPSSNASPPQNLDIQSLVLATIRPKYQKQQKKWKRMSFYLSQCLKKTFWVGEASLTFMSEKSLVMRPTHRYKPTKRSEPRVP